VRTISPAYGQWCDERFVDILDTASAQIRNTIPTRDEKATRAQDRLYLLSWPIPLPGSSFVTTTEMSRSVHKAAGGTGDIATTITGVSTAAESTTQALTRSRTAVEELSRMAVEPFAGVGRFTR
jgi:hypothetical protein